MTKKNIEQIEQNQQKHDNSEVVASITGNSIADVEKMSEEDMDAIMRKYDRELNTRGYQGVPAIIVKCFFVFFSLFAIYMNLIALWDERTRRSLFVGLIIIAAFVLYPAKKGNTARKNYIPWYDIILGVAGSASFFYFVINLDRIVNSAGRITKADMIIGIVGILILMEACRRSVGIPIVVVVSAFIIYGFFSDITLKKMIYNLFYTTEGVIGTPISVCCTYIVLFIIFGAFLERSGISDFFINLANAIAGSSSGGPAKVAVLSSALCGMVSGSSVANTVTTGSITIPMMKKTGYEPEFAGAVEAAASTGGQIMPPIMGAAAFLMSEMIGMKYSQIVICAILPAILYFAGVFIMVHLEAKRLKLSGIPKDQLPSFFKLLIRRGYLLLPLIILIWMIMAGYTMSRAALFSSAIAIVVSMFDKDTRMTPKRIMEALEAAAKSTISVATACAVAGIIAGVVTMTGLGQTLITAIVGIAGNYLVIALFLTMLSCIVLGMGLPTTATYVIMATTCAPILVTGMNVNVLAAHMFVFYFGIVADITPPVALAAYAGSAIAGSNPLKTGLNASKLAIAAFIVPYIFALNPAMLLVDASIIEVVTISITAFLGITCVSIGIAGYLYTKVSWPIRAIAIVVGILMLYPGLLTDVIGIAVFAALVVFQKMISKKAAVA